jgi:hypothetical protein
MIFNKENDKIFCSKCNDWKDIHTKLINPSPDWECLDCGNIIGYDKDFVGIFFEDIE